MVFAVGGIVSLMPMMYHPGGGNLCGRYPAGAGGKSGCSHLSCQRGQRKLRGSGFLCDPRIDEAAACQMVDYAMEHGINYYDTAWGYHNGNSELVMGKALAKHPRESFYLADKFPRHLEMIVSVN